MILIGGGSRSGKTRLAIERARSYGTRLAYVATAEARDDEMRERAAAHRHERGADFETVEEPLAVARVIEERSAGWHAVVVDCLTIWLSNAMLGGLEIEQETERLVEAVGRVRCTVVLVTNEVGSGIVPDNELARRFRDQAGWLNQRLAEAADEVWWTVFGCSLRVK